MSEKMHKNSPGQNNEHEILLNLCYIHRLCCEEKYGVFSYFPSEISLFSTLFYQDFISLLIMKDLFLDLILKNYFLVC